MSSIITEAANQISQIPDFRGQFEHPLALTGAPIVVGAAYAYLRLQQSRLDSVVAPDFGNVEGYKAANDTVKNRNTEPSVKLRSRVAIGTLVLGAAYLAQPEVMHTTPNAQSESVLIIDISNSTAARDVSLDGNITTRVEAAKSAVKLALDDESIPDQHKIAIISLGSNVKIDRPLTTDRKSLIEGMDRLSADANGGDAAGAINTAIDLLPQSTDPKGEKTADITIISDGTVNDKPGVQAALNRAKERGITVSAIVPGKNGSTYQLTPASEPTPASPDVKAFEHDGTNVKTVTDAKAIQSEVVGRMRDSATHKERSSLKIVGSLFYAGLGAGIITLGKDALSQRARMKYSRNRK